jgi:hypothetical protein
MDQRVKLITQDLKGSGGKGSGLVLTMESFVLSLFLP